MRRRTVSRALQGREPRGCFHIYQRTLVGIQSTDEEFLRVVIRSWRGGAASGSPTKTNAGPCSALCVPRGPCGVFGPRNTVRILALGPSARMARLPPDASCQLRIICRCLQDRLFLLASTAPKRRQKLLPCNHRIRVSLSSVKSPPSPSTHSFFAATLTLPFLDTDWAVVRFWRHPQSPNGDLRLLTTTKNLNKTRPAHLAHLALC